MKHKSAPDRGGTTVAVVRAGGGDEGGKSSSTAGAGKKASHGASASGLVRDAMRCDDARGGDDARVDRGRERRERDVKKT